MKVAVVADIHGNATAFKAVLENAGKIDMVWCIGDVVGYGPDPVECIDLLRSMPHICVAGNHDANVIGCTNAGLFNSDALAVCRWTSSQLDRDQIAFLKNLPLKAEPSLNMLNTLLVHGAPGKGSGVENDSIENAGVDNETRAAVAVEASDIIVSSLETLNEAVDEIYDETSKGSLNVDELRIPTFGTPAPNADTSQKAKLWEYVTSTWQAEEILSTTPYTTIFVGHTHVPLLFEKRAKEEVEFVLMEEGETMQLELVSSKYLINPGSIGQPRDADPRASFILFDTDTGVIEYRRIEYEIDEVLDRILSAGLPPDLGSRLKKGL
jgi:predicted phosphodiesterase